MRGLATLLIVILGLTALFLVERDRWALSPAPVMIGQTPATWWTPPQPVADAPVVVIAHGFAGSQQMMEEISRDLAFAGFSVLAFDFLGHGRHETPLSGDVTTVDGTTALLVDQTVAVAQAAVARTGATRIALIGHSMATDVVIRAGARLDGVVATVAISMYSEAVTADFPENLLVISGEFETRLRAVGLDAVQLIAPEAGEGETVTQNEVIRRTVASPNVEHVGVLYSAVTLEETRDWIANAAGIQPNDTPAPDWMWRLVILACIVILFRPVARILPSRPRTDALALTWGEMAAVMALPILPSATVALIVTGSITGLGGFLSLSAFFAAWGAVQLALLWRWGARPQAPLWGGGALLTAGALVFALALDRYGAAFVPVGPRWGVMAVLLLGAIPLMAADTWIAYRAPWWQRIILRLVFLVTLASVMIAAPTRLGLLFSALPVMALFWLVFATMGAWVSRRQGAETAALPLAVILAWSIAASTPIFAAF